MQIKDIYRDLCFYLQYQSKARHRKGHGIHSPAVYEFVSNVLYDKTQYSEYKAFLKKISFLKNCMEVLEVEDFGAPSRLFNNKERKVSDLYKTVATRGKFGELLFRIVRYYKISNIVELGTSLGVGAMYMASGNPDARFLTIEGNKSLCEYAATWLKKEGLINCRVLHGMFDDVLEKEISDMPKYSLAFIDGNHRPGPVLKYYNFFKNKMQEGFIILDDIHWSKGMQEVWGTIVKNNSKNVTIDLYRMGIVILRKSITPGNYIVRY